MHAAWEWCNVMWGLYHGAVGGLWLIGTLVFWLAVIGLLVWGVRALTRTSRQRADDAMEVLRRRLAAGEIDEAEYEKVRHVLEH